MTKRSRRQPKSLRRRTINVDPDTPPVKGAYRRPDGTWVLPRRPDGQCVRVRAVQYNTDADPMPFIKALLELDTRHRSGKTEKRAESHD